MKKLSKPDTARPVNPATVGFGVDSPGPRLVRRPGLSWRQALLGTAAAGALSFAIGGPAAAAPTLCVTNGAVATCSGDQSAGIASGTDFAVPPVTTLNVNNLTKAITPADGTRGISFSGDAVTITSDTGPFGIRTTGAYGIYGYGNGGGAVTVTSTGNITTAGDDAQGIRARGPVEVTVTSTGNITTTGQTAFGILASSSNGPVTVSSTGNITTDGNYAYGIRAITCNCGSGDVIVSSAGNIKTAGVQATGILAEADGGGAVTVTSTGNITTGGDDARGISVRSYAAVMVTSIGNITTTGARAAGISGTSLGGAVTVTSTGNITTTGDHAYGIFGLGAGAVKVTSTGNITTTGDDAHGIIGLSAGAVTVTSTGNIKTTGNRAFGIYAFQYGGNGAMTVTSTGSITTTGDDAHGILASGNGAVTVTSTGNITTKGNHAAGIYAVSNGTGAVTVTSTGDITTGNVATGIVASGNDAVTVTSIGNITTRGTNARGIHAESHGNDAVTVTSTGNIATTGENASGIVGLSDAAGAVTVTSTGNITTGGANAAGIAGQSAGGPIAITVNSGTVSGGSGAGAGVVFFGGTDNTLVNRGTVMALSGLAIRASTGNDTVSNFGTVIGNVDLGTGTNAFNNMAGGLFASGATVNLGVGNTLTNAGTLSPGGAGTLLTTALTGNLVQTTTGRLAIDFNMAGGSADRVNVSGTANLAGAVRVQVQGATLGPWQQTVLSAAGGTTDNGLSLLASPALQAQLVYPNANDVAIKSSGINFLTPGLNPNQTSLVNAFNGAAATAGLGGPIFNVLLNGPTSLDGYRNVLSQLSGEGATGTQQATFDAMSQFVGLLLDPYNRGTATPGGGVSGYASEAEPSAYASSGRQRSGAERAAYAMVTKAPPQQDFAARWNVWAAGFGGSQTTDGNAAAGSSSTTSRIAAGAVGADYRIAPNTIAGFALAGGGTNFAVGNGLGSGRSDLFQAGAFVRHTVGPAYISAALAYGWQDVTTDRTVTLAGLDQLQARFRTNAYSGRLEAGYRLVSPWMGVGITPYAAGQFTTFNLPAYAEQAVIGSNAFALRYGARDVTASRSELGFRTDRSWILGNVPETTLTLRSRLAWAHDYTNDRSIGATFQSLPGASFVVNGAAQSADKALTSLAAELAWRNGLALAGTFDGEFSGNSSSYTGKAVARYRW